METLKIKLPSRDNLLGFFLIIVLSVIGQFTIEQNFVFLLIVSFFFFLKELKFYNGIINALAPLVFIFILAIFGSAFRLPTIFNLIRDCVHLTTPIFGIIFGYYYVKNFKDRDNIIKWLILYCFIVSVIHITKIFLNLENDWNTAEIRKIGGKGSPVEAFIYTLFIVFYKKNRFRLFSRLFNNIFFVVVTISILLYLSRTTLIAILLFMISFYRITQVTRTQILYLAGVLFFLIGFMVSLQFMDIKRDSKGVESFLYKLKIAPQEIFNADIDINDHTQLWDKWRAYEVKKAFKTMEETDGYLPYIIGMGAGSLVDLGFKAPLGRERMQYIPHIHNGYGYIFFKTGIIGLLVLIFWIFHIYAYIYKRPINAKQNIYYVSVSGIGLYLLFATLVINGIYNFRPIMPIILGMMLSMISSKVLKDKKKISK
ncbi:O-antigen ligase family protein [Winogradskyella luteola]|uniref:O-antigen ligase family protein n=1 Tax=Winogradskyella luteola TaxID=2828330 RepID=A0A9X1FAS0_9FLAO|nr:O-antigen ligase family protein [Winogradskyella luteola]MBV7269165.1 O-antigen ligase family protein [Winogradskyella luteola]